jgi:hypothetical protein
MSLVLVEQAHKEIELLDNNPHIDVLQDIGDKISYYYPMYDQQVLLHI